MFYGEKFENVKAYIDELKNYIDYYNNKRIYLKLKVNESGAIPNSFTNNLIFNFV